jgi:TonB family protein
MLPQSEFESPMFASASAPVAIAALTQDRALIGLLRSTVDPSHDLLLVSSEAELAPHLNSRRVSAALLDSMFIEGDLGAMAERLRATWPDLVLVVVGTAEEQTKVASQITSGVVYRFLHRPVSAPRVRLFVEAALRRHEVENVERTLEQQRPDFSKLEAASANSGETRRRSRGPLVGLAGVVALIAVAGLWYGFSGKDGDTRPGTVAQVASPPTGGDAQTAPAEAAPAPTSIEAAPARSASPEESPAQVLADAPPAAPSTAPATAPGSREAIPAAAQPAESVADRLRQASSGPITEEAIAPRSVQAAPPPPALTHEQRVTEQLALAEAALQRGELATPAGRSAVDLFRGVLELDPASSLAKGGLVRVADRLLGAAERALTAGNAEDAKRMVDVAESLTPATARGAFINMQIEKEHERAALTRKRDADAADKLGKGATYLRLASARIRTGNLIEPAEDNARFYLEAASQTVPDDPALPEISRTLQRELLQRAGTAANAGNAADTERWLANADGAGATRAEMAAIRRSLQDNLIGARADKLGALAQSFTNALSANRLLEPEGTSARSYLLQLIGTDAANPVVATARQSLGGAYLRELKSAMQRNDLRSADAWLFEARTISFASVELSAAESELAAARERLARENSVVGANSLARVEYVAPKYPNALRSRRVGGWVELEFTVKADGSTADIVVTNSNPRKAFDSAAINAISQWRYKPVIRDGEAVDQRAEVRIRFSEE